MATAAAHDRVLRAPQEEQQELAKVLSLLDRLERTGTPRTRLLGPEGEQIELPASAFKALRTIVAGMANGLTMTLIPHGHELTTQQAADLLQISRPYLVRLLEDGRIPFHKVGTHRRVKIEDVLDYRTRRASERRAALEELTSLSEDMGYR